MALFFFFCILITGSMPLGSCADAAQDINDLFPSFREPDHSEDAPAHFYTNISLDIEKLDMDKFKKVINADLRPKLESEDKLETPQPGDTRRHVMVPEYDGSWLQETIGVVSGGSIGHAKYVEFFSGYNIMVNQLNCDLMLQSMYMAKKLMVSIESSSYVNTADTAYRAGFLTQKCNRIFKKLARILAFMRKWQYSIDKSTVHIVLHHRAVRLHVDFLYFYWVLINLDSIYRQSVNLTKPELPLGDKDVAGISIEDKRPKWLIEAATGPPKHGK